jgi:hypothetical protein
MKRPLAFACALALSALPALALDQEIITYGDLDVPQGIDTAPPGPSLGDSYVRRGAIRESQDGPVIGEYYTQATVIFLDPATETSARSYLAEYILKDGTLFLTDIVQMEHGLPVAEGHTHTGAIIGGTGLFAGARGTYTVGVLEGGKVAKTTLRLLSED